MESVLPLQSRLPLSVPRAAPWAASILIACWASLMAAIHPAQYSDSIEQYNWAHSIEWGYWKHPPLATWMMRGAIDLFGVSAWTAPVLAAMCLIASVWFVWQLARMILPGRAADLAIVLWPLHQALSARADVFNHNTVLVLLSSAIAWAAARAAASGRTRDWLVAGLLAGLGMLAKYQALVTIAGVLLALWRTGALRPQRSRRQLAAATLLALAVFAPHIGWLLHAGLPTLHYVERSAPHVELAARAPMFLKFVLLQVGMLVSMLLAAAAVRFWPPRVVPVRMREQASDAATRAWMAGLVGVPMVAVALTVFAAGLTPQKMWGVHMAMFLPLWLAWRIDRARPQGPLALRAGLAGIVLTLATMGYTIFESENPGWRVRMHSVDRIMPAQELARAAVADWQRATACPLRLVSGTGFSAGLVSVYSGRYPVVLEEGDFSKSPWVTPDDARSFGALEVHGPVELYEVPQQVAYMLVPRSPKMSGDGAAIWWRVIPPAGDCGGPSARQ